LLFAWDVYKRTSKESLESSGSWDEGKVEELSAGMDEVQAGKLLFELVGACRNSGIDPESALRRFASDQVSLLEETFSAKG
jgi:hypothetical protein